ncbi:exostosin domain-containing protein [Puniceibacterium confluentis]|uniref:exostosin domain-containing protein n=1 Tax=Puniceibacterium confluentis TaxID=1958944 RepID=UPI0011B3BCA4|nr:exostosin family protein [Puniceibacterium confluentis]
MKKIHLYTPYYLSEDYDRQAELDRCLEQNLAVAGIARIFLLVDDGHTPPVSSEKLTIVPITSRPRYSDWLELTAQHSPDAISVLANSDIYCDDTITGLRALFASAPQALVALSRYEVAGQEVSLHPNPRWSQDLWAVDGSVPVPEAVRQKLDIALGVPRCDNKISYVFSVHGYDVFNPCHFVRSYHLHETQVRSYDMHVDKRILGGTAWVHPSETLTTPSQLVYDIWSLKPAAVERIKVNDTITVKERQGLGRTPRRKSPLIVAYDHNWQFPAITEQHAFERLSESLQVDSHDGSVLYLAFPWATLIDNLLHNKKNPAKTAFLQQKLATLKSRLAGARSIVTTCQHIHMLRFQSLFDSVGVTDIFWSHATKGQTALPEHPGIALHPFPLYPVQAKDSDKVPPQSKQHLFSFVGARANQFYLKDTRNIIIDDLAQVAGGFVAGKDSWHYNKIVYDFQVRGVTDKPDTLVDTDASESFRINLKQSVFSLCPSGTGPNSIRLWESIGLGAIPVIMADTLALPGDPALWDQAAVFCAEDRDSIRALPARLAEINRNQDQLRRKRHAMAQIWKLYGIDSFTCDIEALMLRKLQEARLPARAGAQTAAARAEPAAAAAPVPARLPGGLHSLVGVTSAILVSPKEAGTLLRDNAGAVTTLYEAASEAQKALFRRALDMRNLTQAWR